MGDALSGCSPLIGAAAAGKLRLVRLLIEGGAQVNGSNPEGETALLAACKALRGEPDGTHTVKLLTFLLQNEADPNAQDRAGRTALMYACMEQAGARVASVLLAAGADPSMEDYSGASALVYAVNAQHQPTLKVLMDACRARGHDVIIIATETGVSGGAVTRRYLNVPPSPDASPVSCMSPSDIVLKTSSPNSPEGENVFTFRGTSKRGTKSCSRQPSYEPGPLDQRSSPPPRLRVLSEPWLAIHNLARLNRAHEEALKERSQHNTEDLEMRDNERREDEDFRQSKMVASREDYLPGVSQSLLTLAEEAPSQATSGGLISKTSVTPRSPTPQKSSVKLPACPPPHSQRRRNTLPSVTVVPPPPLHLPPLVNQSESHLQVATEVLPLKSRSMVFVPHPPPSSSSRATSLRPALQPRLPLSSFVTSLVGPPATWCRKSQRRHSVQLE